MQRIAIGLAVGLAAWFGSTLQAEAQGTILPGGPTCINTGATSTTYTATVSNIPQAFYFYLTVSVNGTPQYYTSIRVSHTGTSANVNIPVSFIAWNPPYTAAKGDVIDFSTEVKVGGIIKATNDYSVTVTDPISWNGDWGTKVPEGREIIVASLRAMDRDRREWA